MCTPGEGGGGGGGGGSGIQSRVLVTVPQLKLNKK